MKIDLNIGLNITGSTQPLRLCDVQTALAYEGLIITRSRVAQSSTERTLCVTCETGDEFFNGTSAVFALACTLQQEAIAWVDENGTGHVTGPLAAGWGAFNPAEFLPVVEPNPELEQFKNYLRNSIIPDSRESGFDSYAEDLETALEFLS